MNLKLIMAVVLKTLGISAFGKNSEGKSLLTAEQKTKLTEVFGGEFAEKFEAALPEYKEEATASVINVATAAESQASGDTAEGLVNALRAHHSNVVASDLQAIKSQLTAEQAKNATLQQTVNALSAAPEAAVAPAATGIPSKEGVAAKMRVNMGHAHYAGLQSFLQTGIMPINAATIEVGDLKTEFGTYLSQNGNNLEIIRQIFAGFTSAKYFTTKIATTEWRAVRALITSVSQQFSPKWNPGGKGKFTPLKIANRRHKINYPIIPAEVLDSYMFHLYDERMSPDQMPITVYIWNTLIYPALMQDIEMRMIWKGEYVDHSGTNDEGDVATAPEDSMDGLETILVDEKASGTSAMKFFNRFPDFDFKTASDAQMLAFVNGFVDWLSPFYKSVNMNLFVSAEFKRRYKRAYKNIWGANSGQDGDFGNDKVDFSNNMIVAPDGMYGSPIIFSTPKENMIMLRHKNEAPNVINDVQKVNYEVRLFGEYWLGVGFAIAEAVFAFVPDGYDPTAEITASLGDHDDYQEWIPEEVNSSGEGI